MASQIRSPDRRRVEHAEFWHRLYVQAGKTKPLNTSTLQNNQQGVRIFLESQIPHLLLGRLKDEKSTT